MPQKLRRRQPRIHDISAGNLHSFKEVEQTPQQKCLSCTYFPGQDDETLAPTNPVGKVGQGLLVPGCGKEESGIRSDLEWVALQLVELLVHVVDPNLVNTPDETYP